MKILDFFENTHFVLKVDNFAITSEVGGKVCITIVEQGTKKLLDVLPDQAIAIARALESVAVYAKRFKD